MNLRLLFKRPDSELTIVSLVQGFSDRLRLDFGSNPI